MPDIDRTKTQERESRMLALTLTDSDGKRYGCWLVSYIEAMEDAGMFQQMCDKIGAACERYYKGDDSCLT